MEMFNVVLAVFWVIAGCVSFYFSIGNARVWTSIAVGFFLILLGEIIPGALPFLPGLSNPYVLAMGHIIGTISILVMSHGFQEYYVFTRTLEFEGSKTAVYAMVAGVVAASLVFLLINPEPDAGVLKVIRIVENTNWVFLSLINIDLIRKIYLNIKDTPHGGVRLYLPLEGVSAVHRCVQPRHQAGPDQLLDLLLHQPGG